MELRKQTFVALLFPQGVFLPLLSFKRKYRDNVPEDVTNLTRLILESKNFYLNHSVKITLMKTRSDSYMV